MHYCMNGAQPTRTMPNAGSPTVDTTEIIKLKIETYYENLLQQQREREQRYEYLSIKSFSWPSSKFRHIKFEQSLREVTSSSKRRELEMEYSRRENEFLRNKRIKMGPHDFNTIKIIGKGAFGIVYNHSSCILSNAILRLN